MDCKRLSKYFTFFLVVNLMVACTNNTVFSKFNKIDKDGWSTNTQIPFEFEITDVTSKYDIELAVRHDKNYEYSNLWVKVTNEDGKLLDSDQPTQFKLADKTGQWLGKCSNTYCTQNVTLKEQFTFPDTGKYHLSILQHMRVDNLNHIKGVGLVVTKSAIIE